MFTNVSRPSAVDVLRPFAVGDQFYADTTSTLAKRTIGSTNDIYTVVGGVPVWSSTITISTLTVVDSGFNIVGNGDPTKKLNFQVDTQGAGFTFTEDVGAQTASRTATYPVLTGNSIYAMSNATFTTTRVPFATTNGILTDSASLTYNGTTLAVPQLTDAGLTSGRITFAGTSGILSDDPNLLWNATDNCMSIGTAFTDSTVQSNLRFEQTFTDTQCRAFSCRPTYTPAAGNGNQSAGIGLQFNLDATAGALTAAMANPNASIRGVVRVAAGSVTAAAVVTALPQNASAGTVGDLMGFHVQTMTNSGGGTVTNARALRIESPGVGTNRYGVDIDSVNGGTTNFAIRTNAGIVSFRDTTDATAADTGSVQLDGGADVAKNLLHRQGRGAGVTSTATAAGTTTLTNASTEIQTFTGTTTQTVQFPAANLFGAGIAVCFTINNQSTGTVTPTRAGSDTFQGGGTTDPVLAGASTTYRSNGVSVWLKV